MGTRNLTLRERFRRRGEHLNLKPTEVGNVPISSFEAPSVAEPGESRYVKHSGLAQRIAAIRDAEDISIDISDE
ncbi:MAG: hypothetical protein GXP36_15450 [Actinobacteria bacterium]|uniref:Uncharacterized protein n=1 Tax=hydrothermal vent metagenome TaxID=652676 RepID=A0A3B0SVR4_9ZZZZ|nr:hypothetical protein [Actinomycetota bacterium]